MGEASTRSTDVSVAPDTARVPATSPAAEAEAELNRARAAGESLPPLVRMDLLYHAATEEEAWVDSLQAVIETDLESRRDAGADSAVVTGYLGALEVVRAKHGTWPPSRIKWVRRGVERLDALVAAHPEDAHLRYLRTASTLFLPSLMGREERATADLEILANLLVREPDPGAAIPPAIRSRMVGFVLLHGTWLDTEILDRLAETDG
jgi:hypothetical protein